MEKLPIDEIIIGERHRKALGDLDELAESIRWIGLLHPVVVAPDKTLIAGQRRLEVVKILGWNEVPVRVLSPAV